LIASIGFVFILISRTDSTKEIRYALLILLAGVLIYMIRAWPKREWPFGEAVPATVSEVSTN
jgi:hypothetical protein